ncbi:MAG: hypothetical protein O2856_15175 [Planctomycetota bacterium]|nr:hypothetical protein [Planctomycetota bacterium]
MFAALHFELHAMFVVVSSSVLLLIAALLIVAVSGLIIFRVFGISKGASHDTSVVQKEPRADGKRRAIEIVSQQPPHAEAYKCLNCGATVDSTAEISAEGKVRCNYCNEWSSIL